MSRRKLSRLKTTRLYKRAMEQRWPITPEMKELIVDHVRTVLNDPDATSREKSSAAKILLEAERMNQVDQHKRQDTQISIGELQNIADELEVDLSVLESVA